MFHPTREREPRQSVFIEPVRLRSSNPVAAEAVLALRMTVLERALPAFHVAGKTILFELDAVVSQIVRNGWVIVSGRREEDDEDNDD